MICSPELRLVQGHIRGCSHHPFWDDPASADWLVHLLSLKALWIHAGCALVRVECPGQHQRSEERILGGPDSPGAPEQQDTQGLASCLGRFALRSAKAGACWPMKISIDELDRDNVISVKTTAR